ncbi:uncharacterized protein LOC129601354 isoform X2 [Paramacrobiotus metropolitanus]|uniref:uncharacterized protein LOC129601354 isoform X2 n=1 Tax=Paramacrobiotus metropolitanus TaxID=2943436 RepID=UPI0024463A54|nr:uncharacterized protein LOC129601354 isoform X2 [Paramacrobiotus metropolitanus]
MQCNAAVIVLLYTLLVTNQVTFGYTAGEHAGKYARRGHLMLDDLERKKIYERSPSHSTYEFLTQYYSFICHQKSPGYYGDPHYDCRIFHVCQPDGRRDTFFCPAWTRFNNNVQICDWQHNVDDYCTSRYAQSHSDNNRLPANSYLLQQPTVHTRVEALPESPPPTEEHDRYRNKYEQQEYYKSVYDQQEPKLKFLMDERPAVYYPKRTLLYLPQPHFSHPDPVADLPVPLQEDNAAKEAPPPPPPEPVEVLSVVQMVVPEETSTLTPEDPARPRFPSEHKSSRVRRRGWWRRRRSRKRSRQRRTRWPRRPKSCSCRIPRGKCSSGRSGSCRSECGL